MEAQVRHTPGPWKPFGPGIKASMVSSTLKSGRRVSFRVACCKDGDDDTVAANARLIAAAPDMLAALKDLLFNADHGNGLEAQHKAWDRARDAIAKAEGRAS